MQSGSAISALMGLLLSLGVSVPLRAEKKKHVRGTVPIPKEIKKSSPSPSPSPTIASPRIVDRGQPPRSTSTPTISATGNPGRSPDCQEKHPIETFVQISYASRPQAALTGGVYFASDLRDAPQIFFLDGPGKWPRQISFFPDGVPYFRVSPNGQKLLLATHEAGDEQYDIYLLEPDKGFKLSPLLVDRAVRVESVAWAQNSQWFAFTSNARNKIDMDLYRYDLKTQKSELLTELKGTHYVTDVSEDGQWIAMTSFRSVLDSDVVLWNLKTKSLQVLGSGIDPKKNKETADPQTVEESAYFSRDSKTVFYLSDTPTGFRQLYSSRLDKPVVKLLTSESWEIEDYSLDPSKTKLVYVTNENGYGKLSGFEIDPEGRKRKLLSLPSSEGKVITSPSFGMGGKLFFAQTSPTESSDIWDWKGFQKTQWTQSTHGLMDANCFVKEELVHYPSFDHKEIPAFLYYPKNATGPIPFIMHVHGGPESQYRPMFSRIFQYFLERGFGVFAPNVRGSTGYGREFTSLDNYQLRMDSVKDAIEGAKWLIAKKYAAPGALAIQGGSYGGFMVLRSIQVEPNLFSAASQSVGITNFVTFLKNTKPYRRALREVEYGPLSDETFLSSISPMNYLDKIKTPLLVFHGANDPRVPVSEAEQLIQELKERNVPVEFKIFQDEGHGNAKLRNVMEQAKLTVYFFEKYLKKP